MYHFFKRTPKPLMNYIQKRTIMDSVEIENEKKAIANLIKALKIPKAQLRLAKLTATSGQYEVELANSIINANEQMQKKSEDNWLRRLI